MEDLKYIPKEHVQRLLLMTKEEIIKDYDWALMTLINIDYDNYKPEKLWNELKDMFDSGMTIEEMKNKFVINKKIKL